MIWERRRLSPLWLAVVVITLPVTVIAAIVLYSFGELPPEEAELRDMIWAIFAIVLSIVYWLLTALPLHPISDTGYRGFLRSIGWRPGDPLARGPVGPSWIDFAVAVALVACAGLSSVSLAGYAWLAFWTPLGVMAGGLMAACRIWTGSGLVALSIVVGLAPLIEHAIFQTGGVHLLPFSLAATVPLLLWCQRGLRRSLEGFPWDHEPKETTQTWAVRVGSPFDRLSPVAIRRPAGYAVGALDGGVTAGLFASLFAIPMEEADDPDAGLGLLAALICLVAPLGRFATYAAARSRPFGFRKSRHIRGSLLIPQYDQVFIAPLAALVASAIGMVGLRMMGAPWIVASSLAIWANLTIVIGCPPQETVWALTGGHNISLRGRPSGAARGGVRVRVSR